MLCPSCHQPAATLMRAAFSLQGVSIAQSAKGYFKCDRCGTLLHISGFERRLWYYFFGVLLVLLVFVFLHRKLMLVAGAGITAAVWMAIVLAVMFLVTYGMWKYSLAEIAGKVPDAA